MSVTLIGYSYVLKCLHLLQLKDFCYSAILLATLQRNYRNKSCNLGLIALLLLGLMYGKLNHYVISTYTND